ncbi:MAG: hypothetical protein HKN67_02900 [Saprospiraceae bacterium]|nr:hypothetical protein [Saprospiraceae bacterium]
MLKSILIVFALFCVLNLHSQCMLDSVIIKSILVDPGGANNNFDTNGDGLINSQDEYVEICNLAENTVVDISGWQLGDDDSGAYPDFTFPESISLQPGDCLLIVNDYCPTVDEPESCDTPVDIISMDLVNTPFLGNSGDALTIAKMDGSASCTVVYGNVACGDIDPLDIPPFDINACDSWGTDIDGCPLLISGDSCNYLPLALPIELLEFDITEGPRHSVKLHWSTASEINNDMFFVEWSTNARDFEVIDAQPGAGTSSEVNYYNAVHYDPHHGVNYYRLKQVDLNGTYSYSEILAIQLRKFEEPVIAPNVITDGFRILGNNMQYDLKIYDLNGALVHSMTGLESGKYTEVNLENSGYYLFYVIKEDEIFRLPVIKI